MLEKKNVEKTVEKTVEQFAERLVEKMGLFIVTYDIGTGTLGAQNFHIGITVNTVDKTISGAGRLTQPVQPPLDVRTQLLGTYTPMEVIPAEHKRLFVVASGTAAALWPVPVGLVPNLRPNVHLRMVLSSDWRSGIAWYKYEGPDGEWTEVADAPVKLSVTSRGEARG